MNELKASSGYSNSIVFYIYMRNNETQKLKQLLKAATMVKLQSQIAMLLYDNARYY